MILISVLVVPTRPPSSVRSLRCPRTPPPPGAWSASKWSGLPPATGPLVNCRTAASAGWPWDQLSVNNAAGFRNWAWTSPHQSGHLVIINNHCVVFICPLLSEPFVRTENVNCWPPASFNHVRLLEQIQQLTWCRKPYKFLKRGGATGAQCSGKKPKKQLKAAHREGKVLHYRKVVKNETNVLFLELCFSLIVFPVWCSCTRLHSKKKTEIWKLQ